MADGAGGLRELVSFQLRQLANIYSKGSARVYESRFGLTMNEWRLVALLEAGGGMSLNRLARQAQFDTGLTSRLVSELRSRGIVDRQVDPQDARRAVLSLTPQGRNLVAQVFPVANARVEALLSCLTQDERETLHRVLPKLTERALEMLRDQNGKRAGKGHTEGE